MRTPRSCQNLSCHSAIGAHIQGAAGFGCGSRRPRLLRCGHRSRQQVAGGGGLMPATQQAPQQFVDSADGVRIAVYEEGNREGPDRRPGARLAGLPRVVGRRRSPAGASGSGCCGYDNRGVGLSSTPKPVSAYTMARMADDFAAVIGELSPGQPVHVLAHDWGSVSVWEYLTRPGAGDRVASFTSVSGPAQDQLVNYVFSGLRRPWRPRQLLAGGQPGPAVDLHGVLLDSGAGAAAAPAGASAARRCGATSSTTSRSTRSITPTTWPATPRIR